MGGGLTLKEDSDIEIVKRMRRLSGDSDIVIRDKDILTLKQVRRV